MANTARRAAKTLLLILVLALAAGLPAGAQGAAKPKDGVWTVDYTDSYQQSLTLSVTVKKGALAGIAFPKGYGSLSFPDEKSLLDYVALLVKSPSYQDVDAVSGASDACILLKEAIEAALKKAR